MIDSGDGGIAPGVVDSPEGESGTETDSGNSAPEG